jgi:hypothetical protein
MKFFLRIPKNSEYIFIFMWRDVLPQRANNLGHYISFFVAYDTGSRYAAKVSIRTVVVHRCMNEQLFLTKFGQSLIWWEMVDQTISRGSTSPLRHQAPAPAVEPLRDNSSVIFDRKGILLSASLFEFLLYNQEGELSLFKFLQVVKDKCH